MERLGIWTYRRQPRGSRQEHHSIAAYNARREAQIGVEVPVNVCYQSSKSSVQGYRDEDGAVNRALNETEGKRPSGTCVSLEDGVIATLSTFEASVLLSGRKVGLVSVDGACHYHSRW